MRRTSFVSIASLIKLEMSRNRAARFYASYRLKLSYKITSDTDVGPIIPPGVVIMEAEGIWLLMWSTDKAWIKQEKLLNNWTWKLKQRATLINGAGLFVHGAHIVPYLVFLKSFVICLWQPKSLCPSLGFCSFVRLFNLHGLLRNRMVLLLLNLLPGFVSVN